MRSKSELQNALDDRHRQFKLTPTLAIMPKSMIMITATNNADREAAREYWRSNSNAYVVVKLEVLGSTVDTSARVMEMRVNNSIQTLTNRPAEVPLSITLVDEEENAKSLGS